SCLHRAQAPQSMILPAIQAEPRPCRDGADEWRTLEAALACPVRPQGVSEPAILSSRARRRRMRPRPGPPRSRRRSSMPYETDAYLSRHFQTSGVDLNEHVEQLAALVVPPASPNLPLYREMLTTVIRMAQADRNRWDAKIMLQTLREMEPAFSTLEQFKRRRKVTVFGSARTPPEHP